MRVSVTYWKNRVGGEVERMEVQLKPFGYRMVPVTQWKVLIADEDVEVRKGEVKIVNVKPVYIPENTMVGPLHIMRHALGTVLDVVECGIPRRVEEEKCVNKVLFMAVNDGTIEKGDLVGVLKVFFIKTGLLNRLFNLKPPKIELTEEIVEFNITWGNDAIHRSRVRTEVFGYARTHVGMWEPIVADEDIDVELGKVEIIKIREISLPPNTVVVPLPITRNPYGTVVDVVQTGKPTKVEDEKRIQRAVFLPVESGRIEKGDLIGVMNVYYVGVRELKPILVNREKQRFSIVYRVNGEIVRREVTVSPYGYRRSSVARWEPIIADEDVKVERGKPVVVGIKKFKIPPNTILYPMQILRHAYGAVVDLYCDCPPWRVEEGGTIRKAIFLPIDDGEVRRGELLGIMNVYNVELGPLEKIKSIYNKWVQMSEEEMMAYVEGMQ